MDNVRFWRGLEAEAITPDPRCLCGRLLRSTQSPLCDCCFDEMERSAAQAEGLHARRTA